jgi:exopolysaccharide production protein ExoQ
MAAVLLLITRTKSVQLRPVILHALVLPMILLPAAVLFLGTVPGMVGILGRDATLTGRTELWSVVLGMHFNPIIGTGYESFWLGPRLEQLWSTFWWRPTQAHNGFIETYLNLGWIGLLLLASVIWSAYARAISGVGRRDPCAAFLLALSVVVVPYNFTEASLRLQNLPWVFLLVAAVWSSQRSSLVGQPRLHRSLRPGWYVRTSRECVN